MNSLNDKIKNSLDITGLPESEQEEIILRVGGLIYQNVLLRVLETMGARDKTSFDALLDKNPSQEEVFLFLTEKIPNLQELIDEEAIKFKEKSSNIMDQIG